MPRTKAYPMALTLKADTMCAEEQTKDICCCSSSSCCSVGSSSDKEDHSKLRERVLLVFSGFFAVLGVILHLVGLPNEPLTTSVLWLTPFFLAQAASVVGALAGLVLVTPKVIETVLNKRIDINILIVLAVLGAWLLGDFSEAGVVVFLFCVGDWIEGFAVRRNRESITSLINLTPQNVLVQRDDTVIEVAPEEVKKGEYIVIRPGARVPLDGVVVDGTASLDEAAITGESMPVLKQFGADVYAGSLSVDGRLVVATTATVEDSTLARIIRLVKESQAKRSPFERSINRFARWYTPLIILVAALVAIVPTALDAFTPLVLGGIETWGYRALSVLVIGCPCALVIATPVSVVSALTRAARLGILIKGGAFLELGARIKTVAFDKTGTLTYGTPLVREVVLLDAVWDLWSEGVQRKDAEKTLYAEKNVLALAAALEHESTHPLAHAITQAAAKRGVDCLIPEGDIESIHEYAGRGISGILGGKRVAVGSLAYTQELGVLSQEAQQIADAVQAGAASALIVIYEKAPIAVIAVRDQLRECVNSVVAQLAAPPLNQRTVMLSGDNALVAGAIAQEAGITQVSAGLLPHEKMERIRTLKDECGAIAMVGDGINDAPALATADIGIAANAAASDTALEVADVALMGASLETLPVFFKLAHATVTTIRINIAFALAFKFTVLLFVILGLAGMWAAIAADVGVLILVLLHSMTLLVRRV